MRKTAPLVFLKKSLVYLVIQETHTQHDLGSIQGRRGGGSIGEGEGEREDPGGSLPKCNFTLWKQKPSTFPLIYTKSSSKTLLPAELRYDITLLVYSLGSMRKTVSYLLTIPACILFYLAEVIRGEKICWRADEVINAWLKAQPSNRCTKCGHTGKLHLDKLKAWKTN